MINLCKVSTQPPLFERTFTLFALKKFKSVALLANLG
jgi:hypothetical protein